MYLIIGLHKVAGCKQNEFKKHLDVSDMHLNVCEIHFKTALNSHAHNWYKPSWVKTLAII